MRPISQMQFHGSAGQRRWGRPLGVHFRCLRPGDSPRLLAFFQSLDEDSLYSRFGIFNERAVQCQITQLVQEVIPRCAAIAATVERKIVAIGYYCSSEDKECAEVAFLVHKRYRRHGIATYLLHWLQREILLHGFKGTTAQVETSNIPMRNVFQDVLGKPQQLTSSCGQLTYYWLRAPAGQRRFRPLKSPRGNRCRFRTIGHSCRHSIT